MTVAQLQTAQAFSYQWAMTHAYESAPVSEMTRRWLVERYGPPERWVQAGALVWDAGCGGGLSALAYFGDDLLRRAEYWGLDLAAGALAAAERRFFERGLDGQFIEASIADTPEWMPAPDVIFCEGVLHHTDDPPATLAHLYGRLSAGGHLLFYVYRRKAPLREFADDYIRDELSLMTEDQAWEALLPLTRLGRALGRLGAVVEVEEDVGLLGIEKGTYDVQRLFYWCFCKAFYRDDLSLDEMNHINFDWYRPSLCHRQSPDEVRAWCLALPGAEVVRFIEEEAGISVVIEKNGQ